MHVFRDLLSICVCAFFPFWIQGWDMRFGSVIIAHLFTKAILAFATCINLALYTF